MPFIAKVISVLRQNLLMLLILSGVSLGIIVGLIVRPYKPSHDVINWLGLPGEIYLRMLKMMIVPLIITSVITGTSSLGVKANGKVGVVAFIFIFVTNGIGAFLGLIGFLIFRPGTDKVRIGGTSVKVSKTNTQDIFLDLFRNIFPDNVFEATFRQSQTQYKSQVVSNGTNHTDVILAKYVGTASGPNLLGLIFACTVIGIAAASLKERAKLFIDFFQAATDTIIRVLSWFMWTTPIGVFSLILVSLAVLDDVSGVFRELGLFIGAVIIFLVVQQLICLPLILFAFTRRNPYKHLLAIIKPWLICFAASSTAIAIPDMLKVCEEKLHLDKRVARFVIPFSVTLSANGSAVFITCSCLFIANLSGSFPTLSTLIVVTLLSTISSLAIPSVPSSSIVTIVMILSSLGIPSHQIALLLTVEFLLDRMRTTNSCVSHTMCVAFTCHYCLKGFKTSDIPPTDVELNLMVEDPRILDTELYT